MMKGEQHKIFHKGSSFTKSKPGRDKGQQEFEEGCMCKALRPLSSIMPAFSKSSIKSSCGLNSMPRIHFIILILIWRLQYLVIVRPIGNAIYSSRAEPRKINYPEKAIPGES